MELGEMNGQQMFVHIGLPKAASTMLQTDVFPRLTGVEWLGNRNQVSFDPIIRGNKILISDENLSGRLLGGTFREDFATYMSRLGGCCPRAGIILCLRRPDEWLKSVYRHYLYMGYGYSPPCEVIGLQQSDRFTVEDLKFSSYIQMIESCFSREPLILTVKRLSEDFSRTIRVICRYLNIDPSRQQGITASAKNVSVGELGVKVFRCMNRYGASVPRRFTQPVRWLVRKVSRLFLSESYRIRQGCLDEVRERLREDWEVVQSRSRDQCRRLLAG